MTGSTEQQESNGTWYDVVRRDDQVVVFSFPTDGRYLIYRSNGLVSCRPMLEEEEIFTLNGFMQFATRLGYRVIPPSDIIKS